MSRATGRVWAMISVLGLVVSLGAGGGEAPRAAAQGYDASVARPMTGVALRKRQKRSAKTILVDTRSTIDGEVLDGAVNVPPELISAWASRVPKTATIVAYCTCEDDGLAIEAVLELQKLGYRNAYYLKGGVAAARAAGVPAGRLQM